MLFQSVLNDCQRLAVSLRAMLRLRSAVPAGTLPATTLRENELAVWYAASGANVAIQLSTRGQRRRARWAATIQNA